MRIAFDLFCRLCTALAIAAVASISDFDLAWPAESADFGELQDWHRGGNPECDEYLEVMTVHMEDDGTVVVGILLGDDIATDSDWAFCGGCLWKLMDAIPDTYGKEILILNEKSPLPHGWNRLSPCRVEALVAPWDEYGIADSIDEYLELCLTGRT